MSKLNNVTENQIESKFPPGNFVPYACHFNPETILTKSGELLQTIKIEGFNEAFDQLQKIDFREVIRNIISTHIKSSDFSFYLHTIRKRKSIDPPSTYHNKFSSKLHKMWVQKNFWHDKFVNDLYITIIHKSLDSSLFNSAGFLRSIFFQLEKDFHTKYLIKAFKTLEATSSAILNSLSKYGAERLSIKVDKEGAYSENLMFFSKIIHLTETRPPLPVNDLSLYLTSQKMFFGSNSFEIYGETKKHFGSIFSLKEYQDTSLNSLNKILQLPVEFVITQTINFIPPKKAKKPFEYQNYIYQLNQSPSLRKISGIESLIDTNVNPFTDFAHTQITIMVIADDIQDLQEKCSRVFHEFTKLGFLIFKEDLNLEQCFWSQLPANFTHIKRKSILSYKSIGGFSSNHYFSAGRRQNKWGSAVTLLRTIVGNPYFFNFHVENNGYTIILGQAGTGRKTLLNFLLSESLKYNPTITIIESSPDSEAFIKALGGSYQTSPPVFQSNLVSGTRNEFLKQFFKVIDNSLTEDVINNLINIFFDNEAQEVDTKLSTYVDKITELLTTEEFNNYLFSTSLEKNNPIQGHCIASISSNVLLSKIVILSSLFNVINNPNKEPKILVIDNSETLLNDSYYTGILSEILKKIEENNGIVIFIMNELKTQIQQENFTFLSKNIATIINTPPAVKEKITKDFYGLDRDSFEDLRSLKLINRTFLLRQEKEMIMLELSLNGLDKILDILSASRNSSETAKKISFTPQEKIPTLLEEILERVD